MLTIAHMRAFRHLAYALVPHQAKLAVNANESHIELCNKKP